MKRQSRITADLLRLLLGGMVLAAMTLAHIAQAQTTQAATARVLGSVVTVNAQTITVKPDASDAVSVAVPPEARVQRVAPGEKDLSKAEPITAADIAVGDRVLVRGAQDAAGLKAISVVVMSARAIANRNEAEQKAWRERGAFGIVDHVDADTGEIKILVRSATATEPEPLIVIADKSTSFLRYKPDSIRFADAAASSIAEVRKGDQLRVLGNKDGGRMKAEQVVFGTFHTVAGTVTTVSAADGSVTVKNLQTGKPLLVHTKADTQMKKFGFAGAGGGMPGPGGFGGMGPAGAGGFGPSRPQSNSGSGAGPGMGMRRNGAPDLSAMLDRMPGIKLEELKTGETVIISSTAGEKPGEVTAIVLVAGAEPIIAQLTARAEARRGQDPLAAGSSLDRGLEGMLGMPVQ